MNPATGKNCCNILGRQRIIPEGRAKPSASLQ